MPNVTLRELSQLPSATVDALLIWPRGGNAGDLLITDACERYLRDRGIQVWRSDGSVEEAALADDTEYLGDLFATFTGMVIFPGGGNIGIYPDNEAVRAAVVSHLRPRHHCLIFPQSALKPEPALVAERITVWCRDQESASLLANSGTRTELVPDIALYMDDLIHKYPNGDGAFFIKRAHRVDAETIEHGLTFACPTTDLTLTSSLEQITTVLRPYELVLSDRLHGGLIALMMRKKVVLLPVGYHKVRAFYSTWLKGEPGVIYVETQEQLLTRLQSMPFPTTDLAALFRSHADPAFDRFLLGA